MSFRELLKKALKSPVQRTKEQQAQITRSLKYRISIKESGLITKHEEFPEVPEVLFGDPVNFRFPITLEQVQESITAFNTQEFKEEYNHSEWVIIGKRIGSAYPGWEYDPKRVLIQPLNPRVKAGGPGSGHHGHAGRPGKRGGSAPGKGGGGGGSGGESSYSDPSDPADEFRRQEVDRLMNEYEEAGVWEDRTQYNLDMLQQSEDIDPETTAMLYVDLQKEVTPTARMPKVEARAEEWYKGAKEKQTKAIKKWKASTGKMKNPSAEFKALSDDQVENLAQHNFAGLSKVYRNSSEQQVRQLHRMLQKATGKQETKRVSSKGRRVRKGTTPSRMKKYTWGK